LIGPKRNDQAIRPTSDRVREAIFNILGVTINDATVLDLFAGTGSFGLESLSRGAQSVVFIDQNSDALKIIGQNLRTCFTRPAARAFQYDLTKSASLKRLQKQLPENLQFNLVFLDPPYEKKLAVKLLEMVEKSGLLAAEALVIAEERLNQDLPDIINGLQLTDKRHYGETGLWFYETKLQDIKINPTQT
jgi:16S rRNA (guanine966-N2)-methyltransferase